MTDPSHGLDHLAAARWRLSLLITSLMTAVYVGFILLVAFGKTLLGRRLAPGLSVGIALGVLVILTAWALVVWYVRWTNRHYDQAVADIRQRHREAR